MADTKAFFDQIEGNHVQIGDFALMEMAKHGIPFSIFREHLNNSLFSFSDWAKFLNTPLSKFEEQSVTYPILDINRSEQVIEVVLLEKRGQEVFGSKEKFRLWLNSSLPVFNNAKPISFLSSRFGIKLLARELGRIEHGILA